MSARIKSLNISINKGQKKVSINSATFKADFGIVGDAHAGTLNRQVSLLAQESIDKMRQEGLEVGPGAFAENVTTIDIDLLSLKLGNRINLGKEVELEITQIGKECINPCEIYKKIGHCIMPKEGIFAKVINGGELKVGDTIGVDHD